MKAIETFSELLAELIKKDGGRKKSFAIAVRVSASDLSRMLHSGQLPSIATCLRIATHTRRSALVVLRAAGHIEVADLLHDLLAHRDEGPRSVARVHDDAADAAVLVAVESRVERLTPAEARFAADMRQLPKGDRVAITNIVTRAARWNEARRVQKAATSGV